MGSPGSYSLTGLSELGVGGSGIRIMVATRVEEGLEIGEGGRVLGAIETVGVVAPEAGARVAEWGTDSSLSSAGRGPRVAEGVIGCCEVSWWSVLGGGLGREGRDGGRLSTHTRGFGDEASTHFVAWGFFWFLCPVLWSGVWPWRRPGSVSRESERAFGGFEKEERGGAERVGSER